MLFHQDVHQTNFIYSHRSTCKQFLRFFLFYNFCFSVNKDEDIMLSDIFDWEHTVVNQQN